MDLFEFLILRRIIFIDSVVSWLKFDDGVIVNDDRRIEGNIIGSIDIGDGEIKVLVFSGEEE